MEHLPCFVTLVQQYTFEFRHSLSTVRREREKIEYRHVPWSCHRIILTATIMSVHSVIYYVSNTSIVWCPEGGGVGGLGRERWRGVP